MKRFLAFCIVGLFSSITWANEHPACYDIHYAYQKHSIDDILNQLSHLSRDEVVRERRKKFLNMGSKGLAA